MSEKVLYTQKAPGKSNTVARTLAFILVVIVTVVLLFISSIFPYSTITTLLVFAISAYMVYKLLANMVFDITYVLYDDHLSFVRTYGQMKWENEVFPLGEAKFYADRIEHRGRKFEFHPDEELKSMLGV